MKLRAHVYRDLIGGQWWIDIDHPTAFTTVTALRPSWPEAMLTAYALLHQLDKTLMDQVHEERAERRAKKTS